MLSSFFSQQTEPKMDTNRPSSTAKASMLPCYCVFLRTDNVTIRGTQPSTLSYIHHSWLKSRSSQGDDDVADDNTRLVGAGKSTTQRLGYRGVASCAADHIKRP